MANLLKCPPNPPCQLSVTNTTTAQALSQVVGANQSDIKIVLPGAATPIKYTRTLIEDVSKLNSNYIHFFTLAKADIDTLDKFVGQSIILEMTDSVAPGQPAVINKLKINLRKERSAIEKFFLGRI